MQTLPKIIHLDRIHQLPEDTLRLPHTNQSGSSSILPTTNNSTSNIRSAPPTAAAPSVTNTGSDVCLAGASAGVQTFGIGVSGGKSFRDKNCERIKLSRELNNLGMKVAAVAILCQDERVFLL